MDVAWQQSELYISNGGGWAGDPECYEKFGKWMERKEPIQIASLGLFDEVIEFNDGRHRFAWLRDHGVKIMPVHVDPDKVELVKSRFEALAGLISSLGEAGNLLTRNGQNQSISDAGRMAGQSRKADCNNRELKGATSEASDLS